MKMEQSFETSAYKIWDAGGIIQKKTHNIIITYPENLKTETQLINT